MRAWRVSRKIWMFVRVASSSSREDRRGWGTDLSGARRSGGRSSAQSPSSDGRRKEEEIGSDADAAGAAEDERGEPDEEDVVEEEADELLNNYSVPSRASASPEMNKGSML